MHIACVKNHGAPYLQLMENYSEIVEGQRKEKKRTIKNIGPMARFDDGKPDFLGRLRRSFEEGNPIIPELAEHAAAAPAKKMVSIQIDLDNDNDCFSDPKNIGYFILDGLYDALGIYEVLNLHKSRSKIAYDLNGLVRLLVFGRALSPESKIGTFRSRNDYLFGITDSELSMEMYRALDVLNEKSDTLQKRMNLKIGGGIGRNTEVCFYDVTNYYFEIGENDEDIIDSDGRIIQPGLRKKGVSKEKRSEPIVQMGLFIDDNGLPIAYQLFPGNNTDTTTLRPVLEKTINSMNFGRVIVVADGGLNSGPNIAHILSKGNGYILSKSTKKSPKDVKKWIRDESGYEWNEAGTFKLKSKIWQRKIKDSDGNTVEINEKLICYWSQKHYNRELHENTKFISYLNSVIENPDKLKDKQKKIEKFLVKRQVDKETGEILNTQTHLSLDMVKIQEYLDLLGYYTIMTSEVNKPDKEIINKYHGLSRIEDSFRITKSDLEGRPVYVRKPEHINAHFLLCFIALTMIRLIQFKVLKYLKKDTLNLDGWESGLTAERIQESLRSWSADALPNGYYRLTKPSDDLQLILSAFGVNGMLRLPTVKELKHLKTGFDKATNI